MIELVFTWIYGVIVGLFLFDRAITLFFGVIGGIMQQLDYARAIDRAMWKTLDCMGPEYEGAEYL